MEGLLENNLIRHMPWGDGMVDESGWHCLQPNRPRPFRPQCELESYTTIVQALHPGDRWVDPDPPKGGEMVPIQEWVWPEKIWTASVAYSSRPPASVRIQQGWASTCWLLADLGTVSMYPALFNALLVESDESLGVYCFRFTVPDGTPRRVCVDGRVPMNPTKRKHAPLYASALEPGEMWPVLVEKAVAKLLGSYEAMEWGKPGEGMGLLTGAVGRLYYRESQTGREMGDPDQLWSLLYDFLWRKGFILDICFLESRFQGRGLTPGHIYAVLGAFVVGGTRLVKLCNPGGNGREWTGSWSAASSEWHDVPRADQERIGFSRTMGWIFFMSIEDIAHAVEAVGAARVFVDLGHLR